MRNSATKASVVALSAILWSHARGQPCQPYWARVPPHGLDGAALDLHAWDADGMQVLIAGGGFRPVGSSGVWPFATWNGHDWSFATNGLVLPATQGHLWPLDDGAGPVLFGFSLPLIPPYSAQRTKWADRGWIAVDPAFYGPGGMPLLSLVSGGTVTIYGLLPSGQFAWPGGTVARWTGNSWIALGHPVFDFVAPESMIIYDDGSGPALHASQPGGGFYRVAKWDGAAWHPLGSPPPPGISRFCVYDSGSGPELYAGGPCGSVPGGIIRWNGKEWRDVGGGLAPVGFGICGVSAMEVFDDGSGPALFVTGQFGLAGGMPIKSIAKWDGRQWHPLGAGLTAGGGNELAVYDDGRGLSLFVGGYDNLKAGAGVTPVLAQWVGCIGQCYPDCNNDHALTVADFGCFQTKYVTLDPYADCNVDGVFTVADFGCFQTRFVAGCP